MNGLLIFFERYIITADFPSEVLTNCPACIPWVMAWLNLAYTHSCQRLLTEELQIGIRPDSGVIRIRILKNVELESVF